MGRRRYTLNMDQLQSIARKAREREGLILTQAVVEVRGMTRKDVRRAKRRQDTYSFAKALLIAAETICVLVICFLGILTYFEVRTDSESTFYASQLGVELVLLVLVLGVIAIENLGLRLLLLVAFVAAFLLNLLQVGFFLLYNPHSDECHNVFMFGAKTCVTTQDPLSHHSTVAAGFLMLIHLILVILALALLASHPGTLCDIVERTNPRVVRRYLRQKQRRQLQQAAARRQQQRQKRQSRSSRSSRSGRSGRSQRSSRSERSATSERSSRSTKSARGARTASGMSARGHRKKSRTSTAVQKRKVAHAPANLDITKLPDGTRFKTSNNKSFHMEYYVENGVFVGSGTETTNKAISICAPVRPGSDPSAVSRSRRRDSDSGDTDSRSQTVDNKNLLKRQETRNV